MGISNPTDAGDPKRAFRIHLEKLRASGRKWRFRGTTRASLRRWQNSTRRKLLNLLYPQGFTKVPLRLRRSTTAETNLYRHEKIWYDTLPGISVPAALLIPKAAPLPAPAVLCPPGHGNGVSQVLDANSEYKGYPLKLAELGFVCLVPEHLGFGERADPNSNDASHLYYYISL
ncbi:MAG: alpha/beta hydrolase family protein, partial [Armatimonadota bacterium]